MLFIIVVVVNFKRTGILSNAARFTAKVPPSVFPVLFGEEQDKNKTRSLQLCVSLPPSLSHSSYELRTYYLLGTVYSPEISQTQSLPS